MKGSHLRKSTYKNGSRNSSSDAAFRTKISKCFHRSNLDKIIQTISAHWRSTALLYLDRPSKKYLSYDTEKIWFTECCDLRNIQCDWSSSMQKFSSRLLKREKKQLCNLTVFWLVGCICTLAASFCSSSWRCSFSCRRSISSSWLLGTPD